jgi:hypothetical protein
MIPHLQIGLIADKLAHDRVNREGESFAGFAERRIMPLAGRASDREIPRFGQALDKVLAIRQTHRPGLHGGLLHCSLFVP